MTASFKELLVWQKSIDLIEHIYRMSSKFPASEMYGLTGQVRRAAISIASNIAEGAERDSTRDFLRFLSMARGSQAEVETQIIVALRLGYLNVENADILTQGIHEIGRMINGLQRSLSARLENA